MNSSHYTIPYQQRGGVFLHVCSILNIMRDFESVRTCIKVLGGGCVCMYVCVCVCVCT